MRGRAPHVLAGIVATGVLAGGLVWWQSTGDDPPTDVCGVETASVAEPEPGLLPVTDLLPAGSIGDERRPLVAAADEVARALGVGEVMAGRFHESPLDVPGLVPLDAAVPGHVLLAVPAAEGGQALTALEVPGGGPTWRRSFAAPMRGGGLVGEHLVVLAGGARPGVLVLDPADGRVRDCLTLDDAGADASARVLADQAGPEVVLVTSTGAGVTVHKVDPASAEVPWTGQLEELTDAGSVTVVPDEDGAVVVVGGTVPDPVLLADLAAVSTTAAAPSPEALFLADGRPAWTHPTDGSAAAVVAEDDGVVVVLSATPDADAPQRRPAFSVAALDAQGTELWRADLGREPVGAELWGDTVVLRGTTPVGRLELRGVSVATGTPTWRLTTPAGRGDPDRGLGAGTALGDRYVVAAPAGLLEVDPRSGEHRLIRTDLVLDQLLPVGDLVLLRSGAALLVVGPV